MDDQFSLTKLLRTTCSLNPGDDIMTSHSSSSVVASNTDILIQILLCLRVQSLLVFKLVSKQWYSLISGSYFTRKHAVRTISHPIPGLFIQSEFSQFLVLDKSNINVKHVKTRLINLVNDISIDIKKDRMKILQSCNGLILCRRGGYTYHIFNPTTGHIRILPLPLSVSLDSFSDHLFNLAFNPIKSSSYEVIYMQVTSPNDRIFHYHIEIYSSKTDTWRVSVEHTKEISLLKSSGVFWNGSLHWVVPLLYFDIDQGLFKTMPMPASPEGRRERIEYFGECRGHLHLIKVDDSIEFDIFEMETDYSGWIKRYHVNLGELPIELRVAWWSSNELLGIDKRLMLHFNVLLVEGNAQDSFKLVLRIGNKYISFDLKDRSFKIISGVQPSLISCGHTIRSSVFRSQVDVYQCIDSLASV